MRLIVTRPEPEARAWVQALARPGLEALALPLITIHPVSDPSAARMAWQRLGDYAALMFVSGAAVEHFFALRPGGALDAPDRRSGDALDALDRRQTRFWGTGPGTAAALLRHGVEANRIDAPATHAGQFDSEALWQVVQARVRAGDRVLIVRGGDRDAAAPLAGTQAGFGRDWLARRLVLAQARVEFLLAYWRGAPVFGPLQLGIAQAGASDGSIWLFTSAQAVANLGRCLPRQSWARARALATHARIADAARAAGFGVVWQSRPSVADVVASIESNG